MKKPRVVVPPPVVKAEKLSRQHKTLIHMLVIAWIAFSLVTEGGKTADWSFLALSILCEVC